MTSTTLRTPLAAALALLLPLTAAHAAWEFVPDLGMLVRNNDNVLMDTQDTQSASSATLDAGFTLSNFSQRGNFSIEPSVVVDRYSGAETKGYDTEDYLLNMSGLRNGQRVDLGFRSRYAKQSLINAEFAGVTPIDPDAPPGGDITDLDPNTGQLVFFDTDRERLFLSGYVDYEFTERNSFRFELQQQNVDYNGGRPTRQRSDFEDTEFSVGLIRRVDEATRVEALVTVSQFFVPDNDNTTDTVRIEGSFTRPLAPTWNMYLGAGVQRSEYDFVADTQGRVQNATTTSVFRLGFRKRGERTDWNLDYSNLAQPWGTGYIGVREEFRLYATHRFSERLTGKFGARVSNTGTLDNVSPRSNRDYDRAEIQFEYAFKPTLSVFFGYDLVMQQYEGEQQAESNRLQVGVAYRGRSRRNGR